MMKPLLNIATPVAKKPVGYCKPTTEMFQRQNSLSKLPQLLPAESLHLNGNKSLKEKQLTLIRSLRLSTMFSLMKREWDAWETWKLLLESLNQKSTFQPQQSGILLGEKPQKLFSSPSLIDARNSLNMETILNQNLQPKSPHPITNSSSTMSLYEMKLQQANILSSDSH